MAGLVQAADIYLRVDDHLALVSSNRRGQHPPVDPVVADGRSVIEVLDSQPPTGRPVPDIAVPIGGTSEGAVGAALDRAHRHATEIDEYRVIGDTLQHRRRGGRGEATSGSVS